MSVCTASSKALAYSAVWNNPGMMMDCQYRSVTAPHSACSQSSNHAGTGPQPPPMCQQSTFDAQHPVPPLRADLQARLDAVLAEQDDRARIARA